MPGSQGWVKMAQHINGVEIHYIRNTLTGAVDDFKFKLEQIYESTMYPQGR